MLRGCRVLKSTRGNQSNDRLARTSRREADRNVLSRPSYQGWRAETLHSARLRFHAAQSYRPVWPSCPFPGSAALKWRRPPIHTDNNLIASEGTNPPPREDTKARRRLVAGVCTCAKFHCRKPILNVREVESCSDIRGSEPWS